MGVQGLLQELKHKVRTVNISSFAGKKVGVDAYAWLHRGAYGCATELCTGLGSDKYVEFCMYRIRMMRSYDVEPVVVFDGASHPLKRHTNTTRKSQRKTALAQGLKRQQEGNLEAANKLFQKAIQVTADMAFKLIIALKNEKLNGKAMPVAFIVAPYEADAQLAYQSLLYKRTGGREGVAAIVTEDSDLLAYGASPILYKLDQAGDCCALSLYEIIHESGHQQIGGERNKSLLYTNSQAQPSSHNESPNLEDESSSSVLQLGTFSLEVFQIMCVLSGCDFLNIKNFGIKSAYKLCRKYHNTDRIVRMVSSSLPKSAQAELKRHALPGTNPLTTLMKDIYFTFYAIRYSRVYDEESKGLVALRPCDDLQCKIHDMLKRVQPNRDPGDVDEILDSILGPRAQDRIVQDIAEGLINPQSGSIYNSSIARVGSVDLRSKRTFPPQAPSPPSPSPCKERHHDDSVEESDDSGRAEPDTSSLRRTSLETPECVSGHLDAVIDPDLRVDETQTASDSCCLAAGDEEGDVSSQGIATQTTQIAESGKCDFRGTDSLSTPASHQSDTDYCSQSRTAALPAVDERPESLRPLSSDPAGGALPPPPSHSHHKDVHKPANIFGHAPSTQQQGNRQERRHGIFDDILNLDIPRDRLKRQRQESQEHGGQQHKARTSRLKQTNLISNTTTTLLRLWRRTKE